MPPEAPGWWYRGRRGTAAYALWPAGLLYDGATRLRFRLGRPYRSRLPVICVGNFTAGGTGKTPLAIHLSGVVRDLGSRPAFLSRGYGGRIAGPHLVDPDRDRAGDVGDEPLLLARYAPTVIARNRALGAEFIEDMETDVIIMDDGMQNPALAKSLTIAVIDGGVGFGNAMVLPAGPLRAGLGFQRRLADAAVINTGPTDAACAAANTVARSFQGPVMRAHPEPDAEGHHLAGRDVVAYAGIARPTKFYETLAGVGANILERRSFADHHDYTPAEATKLLEAASRAGARLVTTEKDWVRLAGGADALADLQSRSVALGVRLAFTPDDERRLTALVEMALRHGK